MQSRPRGHWKDISNHVKYANELKNKLGYKEYSDWYNITCNDFKKNNGSGLLTTKYNSSPLAFLKIVYPEYIWLPWKFKQCSSAIIEDINTHKWFLKNLMVDLCYETLEDLYKLSVKIIIDNGGSGILAKYGNSPYIMIKTVMSDYDWLPWKFNPMPANFFESFDNQTWYITWLGNILNYTKDEDWYKLTSSIILEHYGDSLLSRYDKSPYHMIKAVKPKIKWKPWLFGTGYRGIWKDKNNITWFLKELAEHEEYVTMEDWYKLSQKIVYRYNGSGLLSSFNDSPLKLLQFVFPDYKWNKGMFKTHGYSRLCIEWIEYLNKLCNLNIQHAQTITGEKCITINNKKFFCDGYIDNLDNSIIEYIFNKLSAFCNINRNTNSNAIIFEFYGDYWHGNINITKHNKYIYPKLKYHPILNISYEELYNRTLSRETVLKEYYNVISIWEYDWNRYTI